LFALRARRAYLALILLEENACMPDPAPQPDVIALLKARRSVRQFTAEPVPVPTLRLLLEAAMAAPSAAASDPWEFVVVTDAATLGTLRDGLLFARYVAPAAIVVCANLSVANNSAARTYWVQDCSAAMENLLIAATGLGLGAVWIGLYPHDAAQDTVRRALAIPAEVTPLGMAYVGYPAATPAPRTRYDAHRVYWEQYEPRKRRARKKDAKHQE